MFLEIRDLLAPPEVARLAALAAQMRFIDGRASNSGNPSKLNMQADPRDAAYAESSRIVADAFRRSREFNDFAFPKRVAAPMLARYEPGMKYGPHADAAFLPMPDGMLRSDVSCTVFLSDPTTYEGGELTIHLGVRPLRIKSPPGACILYPSTTLHEVTPVTRGARLVSLTFIESRIPDEQKRLMLYELGEISALEGDRMDFLSRTRLEIVRQNLTRMWSG